MNKIKKLHRNCPICNNHEGEELATFDYCLFDDCPIDSYSDLVSCNYCGFVFYNTKNTQEDFDEFYKNHYLINAYYSIMETHSADVIHQEYTADFMLQSGVDKSSVIYDVGCGSGRLIKNLKNKGFQNVNGVELYSEYVENLNRDGINASIGNAYNLSIDDSKVDCVIYKHILEHLLNLHDAILEMRRVLCDGGVAIIELPDAENYDAFEEYSPLHYFIIEHINYFDLHQLNNVFSMNGFTLIECRRKMLDIAEKYPVPILLCSFKKESNIEFKDLKPNFSLKKSINTWFLDDPVFHYPELETIYKNNASVYIWGLSYRTMMQLAMSQLKHCNIKGFLDSDVRKQGKIILGIPVVSPDLLNSIDNKAVVVIGVGPSSSKMQKILMDTGFSGKVIIMY